MTQPTEYDRTFMRKLMALLEADEFMSMLRNTTLFRDLPLEKLPLSTLDEISNAAKIVPLPKSKHLDLSQSESLYEIISGYVKIFDRALTTREKKNIRNLKNPPALLAWRIPGELLGDFRFTDSDAVLDRIEATDDCLLLELPAKLVKRLAKSHPQIYFNIACNLASKASKTRIRAQILRQPKVKSRIAMLFLELLAEREDEPVDDYGEGWKLVKGTFLVNDIGAFLGYTWKVAERGLSALIKEELLDHHEHNRSGRYVCNEAGLRKYLAEENAKQALE